MIQIYKRVLYRETCLCMLFNKNVSSLFINLTLTAKKEASAPLALPNVWSSASGQQLGASSAHTHSGYRQYWARTLGWDIEYKHSRLSFWAQSSLKLSKMKR